MLYSKHFKDNINPFIPIVGSKFDLDQFTESEFFKSDAGLELREQRNQQQKKNLREVENHYYHQ